MITMASGSASDSDSTNGSQFDVDMQGIVGSSHSPYLRGPFSASNSSRARAQSQGYLGNVLGAQLSLEASEWDKEVHRKAYEAVGKFWYCNNLPLSAIRSPYWELLVAAVTTAGKGFKAPSASELSGELLDDVIREVKQIVEDQKKQWQKFGCTIILDWFTDRRNHTLLNFLVGSNGELIFLKSIDASSIINNAENLSLVLEEVVFELGVQNVVQVVTKNAGAYVVAGRLLQERHPTLFWTPCVGQCLDLLLEDIGKIDWVRSTVEEARDIKKYIYNNSWVLNLMRDHTKGEELVRSGFTRSATNFLMVQSISRLLTSLKQMFVSQAWLESTYSKNVDGERTAKIVFADVFANRAIEIVKVTGPLMRVLCLVDRENNSMGYIYEALRRAKEAIQNCYRGNANRFAPIWEIIDQRWNNQFHQPFHAAGYYLNPKFFFSDSFTDVNGEVMEGLAACIEKMVPEVEVRDLIISELQNFKRASGRLFSLPLAIRGRTTQTPSSWWEDWGGNTPNLQRLALRILSQPCSASGCEHNWSLFDTVHTKKLYKLTKQRLNDLVFVKYNLRLRARKLEDQPEQVIDLDEIDPYSDWTMQDDDYSLFSEDEIDHFERQAMEYVAEEELLPSSSKVEPQAQSSRSSREPQSSVGTIPSTPQSFTRTGKRKLEKLVTYDDDFPRQSS